MAAPWPTTISFGEPHFSNGFVNVKTIDNDLGVGPLTYGFMWPVGEMWGAVYDPTHSSWSAVYASPGTSWTNTYTAPGTIWTAVYSS